MRISSADWFKAGVARQRADPISLGISSRACTILSKLLLLLLVQEGANGKDRSMAGTGRPGCGSRRLIGLRPPLRDSVLIPSR